MPTEWPIRGSGHVTRIPDSQETRFEQQCILCDQWFPSLTTNGSGGFRSEPFCDLCAGYVCEGCMDHVTVCEVCEAAACPLCGGVIEMRMGGKEFRVCFPCRSLVLERKRLAQLR
jgi:hypothetical protein